MSSTNYTSLSYSLPFHFNEPSLTFSWIGFTLLAILLSYGAFVILKPDPYAHIPAVGGSGIISAYHTAKRFYNHSNELIVAGYDNYKDRIYRIPSKDRWQVIVSRPDQIEELRKAPDDVLSFKDFVDQTLFIKYLMGRTIVANEYHIGVVRSQLTKNLSVLFDDLREEIQSAFDDIIPQTDDWVSIHAYSKIAEIVARASNRIFVGVPICREPEYLKVNIDFTMSISKSRNRLIRTPAFLRPLVARYLTTVSESITIAAKYLGPIIQERQAKIDEHGQDYPEKPVDLLSWLMEDASNEQRTVTQLTNRILSLNFAAIHTSSMTFTHTLYHLAAEPHYLQPMREEIESVIAQEGWTKIAMTKMHKLDSFLKESLRYNGISFVSLNRIALKDFTFSDGTFIPKGTFISAAAQSIHHDEEKYPDSEKFDGFRFANIRTQDGYNTTNQFVNTSPDYIPFGHGKHACPGRFFAANELKAMMAYLVLNYDIKMKNEGVRPKNLSIAMSCPPDITASVMFRRRQL
ncbi:hypothetical protein Clacol_001965 [Clathrus columnatus]|uniref:Cytochrome P450 n=1 Tax=Clathrus columnatus TaxID=1419009 RepID=A0AAV5A426_9AGAM|nr:hypothetical protein Clacol_001965 [Clathrus columnatus]